MPGTPGECPVSTSPAAQGSPRLVGARLGLRTGPGPRQACGHRACGAPPRERAAAIPVEGHDLPVPPHWHTHRPNASSPRGLGRSRRRRSGLATAMGPEPRPPGLPSFSPVNSAAPGPRTRSPTPELAACDRAARHLTATPPGPAASTTRAWPSSGGGGGCRRPGRPAAAPGHSSRSGPATSATRPVLMATEAAD